MRTAVIGAGLIAKQHLGALRALDGVELVGVCDLSPITAEATADRFGVKRWYTNSDEMLAAERPRVVHIVTPAPSHYPLAMSCLAADCHVLVEKPLANEFAQCERLLAEAESRQLWLTEDYNYRFNRSVQQILGLVDSGELGEVRHVDVQISLMLFGEGSRFADPDLPHPAMFTEIGAVSDFLTHMAYLAHAFVGPHIGVTPIGKRLSAPLDQSCDYFQCMIEAERATALIGLTTDAQIEGFTLRVQGTKMHAETNLFEDGVVSTRALGGPKALAPIRNGLSRAGDERRAAWRSLSRKLSGGPGAYEGLWELVRQTYDSIHQGDSPPVTAQEVREVNRLCADITSEATAA